MRFGISTHLYHQERLTAAHLREIAEFGFDEVELFASIGHFDYPDAAVRAELPGWFRDAGLKLHSVHAPIVEYVRGPEWGPPLSIASADERSRARAVAETLAALDLARTLPFRYLVLHLGVPEEQAAGGGGDSRASAERSVLEVARAARQVGVMVALELIPNDLSTPPSLIHWLEEGLEEADGTMGICLDTGHAFLQGDLADAIDELSGHLVTTHVHDNRGMADDHLVPFEGDIDWATAMMTFQKVGYEGVYLLELANTSTAREVLQRTVTARRRLTDIVV